MHRNEYSGSSSAPVVQARDVHGNIIVNHTVTTNAHILRPLWLALLDATVDLGGRRGVCVAPGLVLTNGGTGPVLEEHPVGSSYACVSAGLAEPLLVADGGVPGSPVLNWRTGAVCGVLDQKGGIQPLTDVVAHAESNRANHLWLDRLTRDQIAAGRWLHPGPELRRYLKAVAKADHEHQYEPARRSAPRLSDIYLQRQAVRQPHQDDNTPDRISADRLTEFFGAQVVAVPGAGKSSLVRHLAAQSAKSWLEDGTGSYVPVPITAEALTHGLPLPDALAAGVAPVLSHSLDLAALVTLLRDEPLPGVSWLVLVDALDEVPGITARAAVTRQVHDHRQDGTYRFLVTSSALLGYCGVREFVGLVADIAGTGPDRQECLEFAEYRVQGQAGAGTFGSSLSVVQNAWATAARVT